MARRGRKKKSPLGFIIIALAAVVMILLAILGLSKLKGSIADKYPELYKSEIIASASENGIPPAYIAAVIMAESSYRTDAVSSVGAKGLMQIMPETGEWIAGHIDESYSDDIMFDAQTNIRYGSWYLGYMMDMFSNDMRVTTAAYLAGHNGIAKLLKNEEYSDDGITLKKYPSESVETYVNRVMKYYDYYKKVYEGGL